jgi:hypothetical protein
MPLLAVAASVVPAAPARAAGLAERFPAGTVLYAEWSGLPAQRAAMDKTALSEFYSDPEVRKFTRDALPKLIAKVRALAAQGNVPDELIDLNLGLLAGLRDRPVAFGLLGIDIGPDNVPAPQVALVVDLGKGPTRDALVKWLGFVESMALPQLPEKPEELPGGLKRITNIPNLPVTWGVRGDLFALTLGRRAADTFLVEPPQGFKPLTGDPVFKAVGDVVKFDGALAVAYVNLELPVREWLPKAKELLGPLVAPAEDFVRKARLGPDGIRGWGSTVRVEDRGFRDRTLLLDAGTAKTAPKPLTEAELRLIPAEAKTFSAFKTDFLETYDAGLALAGQIADIAGAGGQFRQALEGFQESLKLDIRKDLIAPLGDTVLLYDSPHQFPFVGGFTVVLSVKDPAALTAGLEKLTAGLNAAADREFGPPGRPKPGALPFQPRAETADLGGRKVTFVNLAVVAPAFTVSDGRLVLTLFPQAAADEAKRLADPAAASILADARFKKMAPDLTGLTELSYDGSDWGGAFFYSYGLFLARFGSMFGGSVGIDFDPATLPPPSLLRSRLFPTVSFTRIRAEGVYTETYGFGPGSAQTILAAYLGAAAAVGAGQAALGR